MRWAMTLMAAAATTAVGAKPARADGQQACLDAFEGAQRDRKDGRLRKARESFRACAVESCPALVRQDCTDALAELAKQIPTVRVSARDMAGGSRDDYSLEIDGKSVEGVAGAIELDPGEHVFVFAFENGATSERRVTLKIGDVNVPVVGELARESQGRDQTKPKKPETAGGTPPVVYVLGGVALVGLGAFVGFGLAGNATASCKGSCSDAEIDKLDRQYLLADIGLAIAVASGGAAAYFYFTRPKSEAVRLRPPGLAASSFIAARPLRRGVSLATGVSF